MMMKTMTLSLLIMVCMTSLSFAKTRRLVQADKRVPSLSLIEAVGKVKAFHQSKKTSLKPIFVDEAILVRSKKGTYWKVGVRYALKETGHLYYKCSMSGHIQVYSLVKDG